MHKNEIFTKSNIITKKDNNIIFLNIDGTIKTNNQNYKKHDLEKLQEYLSLKYNDNIYKTIKPKDIATTYYDFDNISIGILHELLERYNANLVLYDAYNNNYSLEQLNALFRIYDLSRVLSDTITSQNKNKNKYEAKQESIKDYILNNNIDNYLIFDEYDYTSSFGQNFRRTSKYLNINDINYANLIFNKKLNIIEDNKNIKLLSNNQELLSLRYFNYKINDIYIMYNKLEKIYCYENDGKEYIEYIMNYLTKNKKVDYILLNMNNNNLSELNISGALDNNNIYTIINSQNDINHEIQECKRKILSIDKN